MVCPESRVNDHDVCHYLRRHLDIRNLAAMRPAVYNKNGKRLPAHGGVMTLNFSHDTRHVRTQRIHAHTKGLLAHTIQLPGHLPLVMLAAYLPGPTSPQSGWAPQLIDLIIAEHSQLASTYGRDNVFIAFDANRSLGAHKGRRTFDTTRAADADPLLVRLCKALDVSPLHGRGGDTAHVTSRNIDQMNQPLRHGEDGREIDFILGSNALDPSRVTVLPAGEWSATNSVTHREIFVAISCLEARAGEAAAGGDAQPQRAAQRDERPHRCPDYDDPRHFAAAAILLSHLRRDDVQEAIFRSGSAEDALTAMNGALLATQQEAWAPRDAAALALDALRADPLRRAGPPVVRRWQGHTLPAPVAALFDEARRHKKAAHRAPDPASADALLRLSRQCAHAGRNAARKHQRHWQGHVINTLEHRRSHNAHSLFTTLRGIRCDDPTSFDDDVDADPSGGAHQRFTDYFQQLYGGGVAGGRQALTGPTDAAWHAFIPRAGPQPDGTDRGACLAAQVTAAEVYFIVYPASKRVEPFAGLPRRRGGLQDLRR